MVNYKPFTFIQRIFLLVGSILEIKCRPIVKEESYLSFADIPASGSIFFGLVETEFSSNPSSRLVYTDFGSLSNHALLFRAFFLLLESITELDVNQFFSVPNSGGSFSS